MKSIYIEERAQGDGKGKRHEKERNEEREMRTDKLQCLLLTDFAQLVLISSYIFLKKRFIIFFVYFLKKVLFPVL